MHFATSLRKEIHNPSQEFTAFMTQYFDDSRYYMRGDNDPDLPGKLKGREKEIAKQLVLNNIDGDDERILHLLVAAKKLGIKEALPKIKAIYARAKKPYMRMYLGGVLARVWGCRIPYDELLNALLEVKSGDGTYHKANALNRVTDLKKEDALSYCLDLVNDSDNHVRYLALKKLQELTGRIISKGFAWDYDSSCDAWHENKYYTAKEVYENKALFEERYKELVEELRGGRWKVRIEDEILKSGRRIIKASAAMTDRLKVVGFKNGAWLRLFLDEKTGEYWEDFNIVERGVTKSYLKEVTPEEIKKYVYKPIKDKSGEKT